MRPLAIRKDRLARYSVIAAITKTTVTAMSTVGSPSSASGWMPLSMPTDTR